MQLENLNYDYDYDCDILYAFIDKPTPATSMEKGNGILIRIGLVARTIVGFTIIDYMYRIKAGLLTSIPEFADIELPYYINT